MARKRPSTRKKKVSKGTPTSRKKAARKKAAKKAVKRVRRAVAPDADRNSLSQIAHRRLIGLLGLLLPILLYLVAGLRPTDGLPGWTPLDSVSAYYYTGAVAIFVGVLFALCLFLFTYPGYEGVSADRIVGKVSALAAFGVLFFPTGVPDGFPAPSWWDEWSGYVHYASAVALFTCFILFSIWLFRKSDIADPRKRPPDKQRRDAVCLACGIVMIAAVLWAAIAGWRGSPIVVPEAIAIMAFALSWLTKGEVNKPIMKAVQTVADKLS